MYFVSLDYSQSKLKVIYHLPFYVEIVRKMQKLVIWKLYKKWKQPKKYRGHFLVTIRKLEERATTATRGLFALRPTRV